MINCVVLVGRLTRDPELRKTQNGTSVCSFTLAVDRTFKSPGQPTADFISCVAWNKTAELMCQYLHKGALTGIQGRMQTRSYDNQQGQRVYVTEVVADTVQFLEPKGSRNSGGYNQNEGYDGGYQDPYGQPERGYGNSGGYGSSSYGSPAGSGYGNNNNGGGYGQAGGNPYSGAYSQNQSYSAPTNPYAKPMGNDAASSTGFDDNDDDGYDIASDDLPF